tara:strand:- start:22436 stop:23245 length:810 start_codon:yes stop_codon:yes gene_type:complete
MRIPTTLTALTLITATGAANAEVISVQVENTLGDNNFFFTPVWVAAHNGGFDSYTTGEFASDFAGITDLAETGNTAPISDAFANSAAGAAGGVDATLASFAFEGDAPVYSPGESSTFDIEIGDASVNRFFSYASMVIPSNDLFFGNDNPNAVELFDAQGNFKGPRVIEIYGRDINDNGTELNAAENGAAFSTNGGDAISELATIRDFFAETGDDDYLASFIGSTTANNSKINSAFGADDLVARITVTPTPSGFLAFAGAGLIASVRRRK